MSASLADVASDLRNRIPDEFFIVQFSRSRGPGGQNVNKVNTRAAVSLDIAGLPGLTDEEKRRIRTRLAGKLTRDGRLITSSDTFRTQRANHKAAVDRLFELLASALVRRTPRRATAPTKGSVRRRLQDKKVRSERKQQRRGTADD